MRLSRGNMQNMEHTHTHTDTKKIHGPYTVVHFLHAINPSSTVTDREDQTGSDKMGKGEGEGEGELEGGRAIISQQQCCSIVSSLRGGSKERL